jgi:predicted  nucleic acid-binding Zn-ribbon protein
MGPTNVALVGLFRADMELREAQNRLDEAGKNVRLQERRVADLDAKLKDAQSRHKHLQSRAGQLDLDMRSRDAHIEKLRTQQQTAKNNKEYQAFLVEINTAKVDRGKVEDEAVRVMGDNEKGAQEVAALAAALEGERAKLETIRGQLAETIAKHQAEVDALKPARQAAEAKVPPKVADAFNRLADRYEGDALSPLARPDRRREEYLCTSCNMELAIDIYNKLHSRDDIVFCPSCRRFLYIPEDLTPEAAIPGVKAARVTTGRTKGGKKGAAAGGAELSGTPVTIEKRAKGDLGQILNAAQGESVQAAVVSGSNPVECEVYLDDELVGYYKGREPAHLERNIRFRLEQARRTASVRVVPVAKPVDAAPAAEAGAPEQAGGAENAGGAPEAMAEAESSPQG